MCRRRHLLSKLGDQHTAAVSYETMVEDFTPVKTTACMGLQVFGGIYWQTRLNHLSPTPPKRLFVYEIGTKQVKESRYKRE